MAHPLRHLALLLRSLLPPRDAVVARYGDGRYGRCTVLDTTDEDGRALRVLEVEGTWQSATYLDDGWADLAFPYHVLYDEAIRPDLAPARVLMLGAGGQAYPKHLLAHEPLCRVDSVEADPLMLEVARRHFCLDRLDELCGGPNAAGRLQSFVSDGRTFVEEAPSGSYQYVFNDCFGAEEPDRGLMTLEAARSVRRILAKGGTYATNVVSALEGPRSELLRNVVATLELVFAQVDVVACGADDPTAPDNNVVLATDAPWHCPGALRLSPAPVGRVLRD